MRNFNLDRLKFRWQGSWVEDFSYRKDDIVYYEGKAFVCLKSHTSSENFYDDRDADAVEEVLDITVSTDTLNDSPSGKFYVNGEQNPELLLLKGRTYTINQDDASNVEFNDTANPFFFSNVQDGTQAGGTDFVSGVKYFLDEQEVTRTEYINGFADSNTRKLEFTVPSDAPVRLFYYSASNLGMGNEIDSRYDSYWELMSDGYSWKGDWTTNTFYPEGSIVKYRGYLYISIDSHTSTGVVTLGITADIDKWILYATTYNWLNEWTTQTYYELGDVVRYNGRTFICQTRHESAESAEVGLEDDSDAWTIVSRSDNWRTDWITNTRYIKDDVVRYGAIVYRCTEGHTSAETFTLGLEADISKWEIVVSGIEYRQDWTAEVRYRLNDVVKYGASLWQCNVAHTSTLFRDDEANWEIYIPGLQYEDEWSSLTEYQKGDVVFYGGYTYTALENNINSVPSVNGKLQDTGDWELLTTGYSYKGEWDDDTVYLTGNVVTNSGYLYVAIKDSIDTYPDSDDTVWQILSKGQNFKGEWQDDAEYFLEDIVLWQGSAYICINRHVSSASDSRPDLDEELDSEDYWKLLIKGADSNVLSNVGDIKTFTTETERLGIGTTGSVLKVSNGVPTWEEYAKAPKVYYVGLAGTDTPESGTTLNSPFRTIRYACNFILEDEENRAPATIFIKTGEFQEQLPISVPANVALVGDELRSTTVRPAPGFEKSNMFYVRNGTGIRNMTLRGLEGELGELNEFLTRRPDAGAYVSLDPGEGPGDESVWITSKSCYVQNVTTLGTGCIGMKVDGSLHNGGNRSIVANDFTQVLSNGIGYWATSGGRSELVSVFTYFCHIGYLSTDGGIVRATNGNNSYGLYGSVAEGFSRSETPITAEIDNRRNEAQFYEAITFGTAEQKILAIGYSHAGQDYSSGTIEFGGTGTGAEANLTEFRRGGISNIRLLTPEDSSLEGGAGYINSVNSAQTGDDTFIRIAQADSAESEDYIGQRIRIVSGKGVGQYAEITRFDAETKNVIVSRESNGTNGWDHFQPGYPIEPKLDETTRYSVEPRPVAQEPVFNVSNIVNPQADEAWHYIVYGDQWLAVTRDSESTTVSFSENGTSWSAPSKIADLPAAAALYNNEVYFVLIESTLAGGATDALFQSLNLEDWSQFSLPLSDIWFDIAGDGDQRIVIIGSSLVLYSDDRGGTFVNGSGISFNGNSFRLVEYGVEKFVAVDINNGNVAVSATGETWENYASVLPGYDYTDIVYGNARFVVIAPPSDSTDQITRTAISFDGIEWYDGLIEEGEYEYISYAQGVFIATGAGESVAISQDGVNWKLVRDDSTPYSLNESSSWKHSASNNNGDWIAVNNSGQNWSQMTTGARALLRTDVVGSRIDQMVIYDPGSNYGETATVDIVDNSTDSEALLEVNVNNGVIPQPEIIDRGEGYTNANAEISGDGFAEIYQTGKEIKVKNLVGQPGPGANITIAGIDDERYSLVSIDNAVTNGNGLDATISIDPPIGNFESPDHEEDLLLREEYSQIRLTGHDFLDIGTGGEVTTRYPDLYLEGETSENDRKPFNETRARGGGRVFYTSTDQDGNFRVGELFEVEQSQGIVTINASQFDLSGLTELALGGIQVGGTQVVIREFSRDPNFVANSNFVVPTQAAIKEYISKQVSGGGSNAQTNRLVAGQVQIDSNRITTTSELPIQTKQVTQIKGGIGGHYLALQYYASGGNFPE